MLKPGSDGTVVYLNADPQLDRVLERVRAAGGEVLVPRTELPDDIGCFALFRDSEGNRVGLRNGVLRLIPHPQERRP